MRWRLLSNERTELSGSFCCQVPPNPALGMLLRQLAPAAQTHCRWRLNGASKLGFPSRDPSRLSTYRRACFAPTIKRRKELDGLSARLPFKHVPSQPSGSGHILYLRSMVEAPGTAPGSAIP